ncbi:MAG: V-type ATP synthase subunit B, partial [Anaerolineae bacterium]|nr:V-type ATP synthase subunit B [Anaerolineae bacterium]
QDVRSLASVIGEEELTAVDQAYLQFGVLFERQFVGQGKAENRTIEQTLDAGWRVLSVLPAEELTRVTEDEIRQYYQLPAGNSAKTEGD